MMLEHLDNKFYSNQKCMTWQVWQAMLLMRHEKDHTGIYIAEENHDHFPKLVLAHGWGEFIVPPYDASDVGCIRAISDPIGVINHAKCSTFIVESTSFNWHTICFNNAYTILICSQHSIRQALKGIGACSSDIKGIDICMRILHLPVRMIICLSVLQTGL